jgi:hypothetical protein
MTRHRGWGRDVAVTTVYLGNAQGTIAEIQVGIPLRDGASVAIEACGTSDHRCYCKR